MLPETATLTPVSTLAVYQAFAAAYQALQATPATPAVLRLLVAHSAFETGWWKVCYNWNLGNAKAPATVPHTFYPAGEELPAGTYPADAANVELAGPEYSDKFGRKWQSYRFSPPHPQCRFAAYPSLAAACAAHLAMLKGTFPKAWVALHVAGTAQAYAAALAAQGYYTAPVAAYSERLAGVLAMVPGKLGALPAAPAWAPPVLQPGATAGARVWAAATSILAAGPVGHNLRQGDYAHYINCGQNPAGKVGATPVASIHTWATSCALFVRAALHWAGRKVSGPAINASPMVVYMGVPAGPQHPAWVPNNGKNRPTLGSPGYWAPNWQSNMGHTEVFGPELAPGCGVWHTAGGGGTAASPGTGCSLRTKDLGKDGYGRPLLGWWAAEKLVAVTPAAAPAAPTPVPHPDSAEPQAISPAHAQAASAKANSDTQPESVSAQPPGALPRTPQHVPPRLPVALLALPVVGLVAYLAALLARC